MLSSVLITFHKSLYLWLGLKIFLSEQNTEHTKDKEEIVHNPDVSMIFYMA